MFKTIFLFSILILLTAAFVFFPHFQEVAAGVAILLFGMISLENGFKSFAEGPLKILLSKATDKFYKSFTVGVVATAVLQSSSLISIITISFLSAGLLSLYQGIGIVYGANLGSTVTAWLVAALGLKLKISLLAMPMIVFGVVLFLQSNRLLKGLGNILAGLGFFFFGIALMKSGFDAYQESLDLTSFVKEGIFSELLFLLLGILITVILQSSGASMAIILAALSVGQITYLSAMTLAIGANVGTTITAMIGAIASNADGKRVAVAHLLFNLVTAVVAIILLRQLGWLVNELSGLMGIAEQNYTLKLALFHTLFNLLGIVVMRPFVKPLIKFLTSRIHEIRIAPSQPQYLNESALNYPLATMQVMIKETKHLFEICFEAIAHGLGLSRTTMLSKDEMKAISKQGELQYKDVNIDEIYYLRIKNIYGEIIRFGARAQRKYSDAKYVVALNGIMDANRYFVEVVKDVKDLQPNVLKYVNSDNQIMKREYNKMRKRIAKFIRLVFEYQSYSVLPPVDSKEKEMLIDQINSERETLNRYIEKTKSKDILYSGTLGELVRQKTIDGTMVTSLINDYAIVNSINKHLVKASTLLYLDAELILADLSDDEKE